MLSFDTYVLMLLKTFSLGFLVFLVFKSGDLGGILNNCHPAVSIVSLVKVLFCDGSPC